MRPAQLRGLSDQELASELQDNIREVFNLRFRGQSQKIDNPSELSKARRNIARVKTIMRERKNEALKK